MASIEKRGESSYRLIVSNGYDKNGKQVRKKKTIDLSNIPAKKRDEEATKQWILFQQEVESGTYIDASKLTFEDFIIRWRTDYANKQLAPKTLYGYNSMLNLRIIPALGHIKLNKIQPTHLMNFYNNLAEDGMRLDSKYSFKDNFMESVIKSGFTLQTLINKAKIAENTIDRIKNNKNVSHSTAMKISTALGMKLNQLFNIVEKSKGMSETSILHHHRLISSILQDAVEWQLILSNPATRVKSPKVTKRKIRFYNEEQTRALIVALDSEPIKYKIMVLLDIFAGLRCGELMGLEWTDVNFDECTININKASQYCGGIGTFTKGTKNKSSERIIAIPEFIITLLKQFKIYQNEEILKLGNLWKKNNRIFTSWDGKPQFTYALTNWFPEFLERHNLPKITPHGLRHTSASLLAAQGLDVTAISKRLGHARTSTTMDIYAHALQSSDKTASNMLEDLLTDGSNPKVKEN